MLGETVKNMRLYKNLTQKELADVLGTTQEYISAVENKDNVSFDRLVEIAGKMNFQINVTAIPTNEEVSA